ncbi:MAG: dolichol kinase [Bacteroidetes bacterium]|nr:dolichol kinase [Bacteroidota bacterium]
MEIATTPVTPRERQISMSNELVRKSIHLSSLAIVIFYAFVPESTLLWILLPLTILAFVIDYGRHYVPVVDKMFQMVFGKILRPHETDSRKKLLSGGTYVLISAVFCVVLFPKVIAITSFATLIVSDATSALIGRRFGRHRFFDKSVEGSTAFLVSAMIVVALAPKVLGLPIEYGIGFVGVLVGTLVEAMSVRLKLDDNFSVPSSVGITMWLCYLLLSLGADPRYSALYTHLVHGPQ